MTREDLDGVLDELISRTLGACRFSDAQRADQLSDLLRTGLLVGGGVRDDYGRRPPHFAGSDGRVPSHMAIVLYHCRDARSLRPLWALEEMGLEYELRTLPFPPRVLQRDYLEVNPLGTVPCMVDGDVRMTESSGICHYLVERYGPTSLAVSVSEPEYGAYLNWLYFSDATLTFPQTIYLRYSALEPEERRLPQAAEDYKRWFAGRLRAVEAATNGREFLCAGRFTIADICVGYGLHLARNIGLGESLGPNATRYFDLLRTLPSYQRATSR